MMLVPEPTLDQEAIREQVSNGSSLRIVAHAGTGKTSTLLWAFVGDPRKVLFLEYNRDLRLQAKELARLHGLSPLLTVHNYDSFLVEFYDPAAPSKDFQLALQQVLHKNTRPLMAIDFDVIVIDEAQDMTDAFALFVKKILIDNACLHTQLILAGDPKQTIYAFRGATTTHLVGETWDWPSTRGPPLELSLAETFRFGDTLCGFVNSFCAPFFKKPIWGTDIVSARTGGKVELWSFNVEGQADALLAEYLKASASLCVLASSIREENQLLTGFLEITSDADRPPLEEEEQGQPVLRTIHTSKGKQYDTVFLFMSNSEMWLTPTGRLKAEKNTLLYVACTRARQKLIVVEAAEERLFSRMLQCFSKQAMPPVYCAQTGRVTDSELIPLRRTRLIAPVSRATLTHLEKKLSISDKEKILASVTFCITQVAEKLAEIGSDEELTVRLRAEWKSSKSATSPLWPLLTWAANGQPVSAMMAYSRLASKCHHRYLRKFEEPLTRLETSLSTWQSWTTLMHFHPLRRYGHSARRKEPPDQKVCDALYAAFIKIFAGLEAVEEVSLSSASAAFTTCSFEHCFYWGDKHHTQVLTPVFCSTEATRPKDICACIIAAGRLGVSLAGILYLQRGTQVLIKVTPAAILLAEKLAAPSSW